MKTIAHRVLAILLILTAFFCGCVKEDVEDYDQSIVGVWNYSWWSGSLFGSSAYFNYIFYADGTYQFTNVEPGKLLKINGKQCKVEIDETERIKFIADYGYEPLTKPLPYHLKENLLILKWHEDVYDTTTPIVNDTLEIVELKKCYIPSGIFFGKSLTIKNYNGSNAEPYTLHLYTYRQLSRDCSPCGCE